MRKLVLLIVLTIFTLSCGYKVKTYPHYTFFVGAFDFRDPMLLEFKKEIEWIVKDGLYSLGFEDGSMENSDLVILLKVEHFKTITVQSGSDNRQTAKELRYRLNCTFKHNGKIYKFKDNIKLYQKFPVNSENFVDARKELATQLGEEIALRVNSWVTKVIL